MNNSVNASIEKFLAIIAKLRNPEGGCPWDLEQDFNTMIPHLLEESYEVVEAIQKQDWENLNEELGDLLLQVVFLSQLAQEANLFNFNMVVEKVTAKMIHRHPHVFGEVSANNAKEALQSWNAIKAQEKAKNPSSSILDNIPYAFPALTRAEKIQKACKKVGFDWDSYHGALAKVQEEIMEVQAELERPEVNHQALEEEMGDLLFACVNLNRHLHLNAEKTLRKSTLKFEQRFRKLEQLAQAKQLNLTAMSLEEIDKLWDKVKAIS